MPAADSYPTPSGSNLVELLEKIKKIDGVRLAEAIPKELFKPSLARGLLGFFVSYSIYISSVIAVAYAPHWLFYIPLWFMAGLGGWGLHCIAHDCGHNSFSRNTRLNVVVGHLSLLPLVYPFYSWKHAHNLHHLHTNSLELDTDWRPIPRSLYKRMPLHEQLRYAGTRSWMFWAGTISYWLVSGFRPGFFPKREMRRDVVRSIFFVFGVAAIYFPTLVYFTGIKGFFLYFFAPWIATHAWFSATTLMHHTAEDLPFLPARYWTPNASRLLLTTDYWYPKWLLFLTHNISIHTAHHVAPIVPFYNLQKAQAALKERFPGMIREERWSFAKLWRIITRCHFYDDSTGYYVGFADEESSFRSYEKI